MLFVGDDWAEGHHDVEVMNEAGEAVATRRFEEGPEALDEFTEWVAAYADDHDDLDQVHIAIETDHGVWVQALIAAGYSVYAVDPLLAKRHRELVKKSPGKADKSDAHALADMVRLRHRQLYRLGQDSALAAAIKVAARDRQRAVWERTRHSNRLRAALIMYFPAILAVCREIDVALISRPILALLDAAPTPQQGAQLTVEEVTVWLKGRRAKTAKAEKIVEILRTPALEQPDELVEAYTASVRASVAFVRVAIEQADALEAVASELFRRHPDAEVYLSQPGVGEVIGPRILGEFGDDRARYRSAKARKNAAQTSPLTMQSGKKKSVMARSFGNDRLLDALIGQADAARLNDPHANAYYRKQRDRGVDHEAALRQLANKLVGIHHGCLARHQRYDPAKAWGSTEFDAAA